MIPRCASGEDFKMILHSLVFTRECAFAGFFTGECASASSDENASRGGVSTKYFGEVSCTVASRFDRAQSLWFYSDGYGPVHGYRSPAPAREVFLGELCRRACRDTISCTGDEFQRVLLLSYA